MNKKKIIILSVVFLVLLIVLYLYFTDFNHKKLYKGYSLFYRDNVEFIETMNLKPSKERVQYSLSVWLRPNNIYLNSDWNTNPQLPKTIIENNGSPNILWIPEKNIVKIQIIYEDKGYLKFYEFNLENFETQVWSNLVVTLDNKLVTIYKNGEFYAMKKLDNPNLINYKKMSIGEPNNNFNGYIGDIDYYSYVLNKDKIRKLYRNNLKNHPTKVKSYDEYEKERLKKEKESEKIKINSFFV